MTTENIINKPCGIGERLKFIRQTFGLSQRKIADEIGCNFKSWQNYEAEQSIPGGAIITELVKMGINANWLLAGVGQMQIDDHQPIDDKIFVPIVEQMEELMCKNKLNLMPRKKAELLAAFYCMSLDNDGKNIEKPTMYKFLKLASDNKNSCISSLSAFAKTEGIDNR